jgi:general secretion pathway protein G
MSDLLKMKKNVKRKNQKGFTLMEVLIVIALLATLGTYAGVKLLSKLKEGKVGAAKIQLSGFQQALQSYYLDNSVYPSTSQGLDALIAKPSGAPEPKRYSPEGYFSKKQIPKDPWGNDYIYVCEDGQTYGVASAGPDGTPESEDDIKAD